jgi:hypothetical protein
MHIQELRATRLDASIPTAPYAKGNLKIDCTGEASPRQIRVAPGQLSTNRKVRLCGRKIVRFAGSPWKRKVPQTRSIAPAANTSGRANSPQPLAPKFPPFPAQTLPLASFSFRNFPIHGILPRPQEDCVHAAAKTSKPSCNVADRRSSRQREGVVYVVPLVSILPATS